MSWLLPLHKKGASGSDKLNFLWHEQGNVYVMDNHLAAMWCWLQKFNKEEIYDIIHVDMHYDWQISDLTACMAQTPQLSGISLEDYLLARCSVNNFTYKLFRWDNYLPLFYEHFYLSINKLIFATHKLGIVPVLRRNHILTEIDTYQALNAVASHVSNAKNKVIVNIDLDYFFITSNSSGKVIRFIDYSYIDDFFSELKPLIASPNLHCLTIALSPDCCGGWGKSGKVANRAATALGLGFKI